MFVLLTSADKHLFLYRETDVKLCFVVRNVDADCIRLAYRQQKVFFSSKPLQGHCAIISR